MGGGGASPYDLPDCVAVDALASLARRVGASAVLVPYTTYVCFDTDRVLVPYTMSVCFVTHHTLI